MVAEKFIGSIRIDQLRIRLKELDQPPLEEVCRLTDTFFLARRDENLVLKNLHRKKTDIEKLKITKRSLRKRRKMHKIQFLVPPSHRRIIEAVMTAGRKDTGLRSANSQRNDFF